MLMQERKQTWQRKEKGFNSQLYNRTKNIKKKDYREEITLDKI